MAKKPMEKKWYMSRTLWANALVFAIALVDAANTSFGIPPQIYGFIIPTLNAGLRFITETKLSV